LSPVELRLPTDQRTLGAIARSLTTGDRVLLAFAAMAAKRAFVQQRRGDDDDDERASERACTAPKRARTGMATEKSAPD
jgi:hypothetical protein